MRSLIKGITVLLFSMGFLLTANAQDDSVNVPSEDAIVCIQVGENVFDCFLQPGSELEEPGSEGLGEPNPSDPYYQEMNLPILI
jgi:hypothetical protein